MLTHLMQDDLLDVCGTAEPGPLRVTPVHEDVTCPACKAIVAELETLRAEADELRAQIVTSTRYQEGTWLEHVMVTMDDGRILSLTPAEFDQITKDA